MIFGFRIATSLCVVVSTVSIFAPNASLCQTRHQSAAEIIRFLNDPRVVVGSLPQRLEQRRAERAAANELVALGSAAVRDLDAALDRMEQQAGGSEWLLIAYARILGPAARQRLQVMNANRRLGFLHEDLDNALAVALGLTDYVSAARLYPFTPARPEEPRHALDRFILGWMQDNRSQMEYVLGPKSRQDLDSLLARQSWQALRSEVLGALPGPGVAMGFRFEGAGDWSQPEETLDQELWHRRSRQTTVLILNANPWDDLPPEATLSTQFVDRVGKDCGGHRDIRFVRAPAEAPGNTPFKYLIDEGDLKTLLRTVSGCALRSR